MARYRDGKKEGLNQEWCEHGKKWKECNYIYGKLEGMYKEWNQNGELIKECYYKNDIEVLN